MAERVGRLAGELSHQPSYPLSYRARPYLVYLVLQGYATLDYPYTLAAGHLKVADTATALGRDMGVDALVKEAIALGFHPKTAQQSMIWAIARIAARTGILHADGFTEDHINEALEAVRLFSERDDLRLFYPDVRQYRDNAQKSWVTRLHQLHVVLFHRGQVPTGPRKRMPGRKPPWPLPPRMQAVAEKWLAARRLTDAPSTVEGLELAVRGFGDWITENYPGIVSWTEVTRDHCLEWIQFLADTPSKATGKLLSAKTRVGRISALSQLFQETVAWQYDDVPGRALITVGDAPKVPQRVPRFIPDHELDQLMPIIEAISCPFQRAALLAVRWSGARRDEIRRLPLDCLDRYPDGTPRLRIPAGKTYKERMVPIHQDAAAALQTLIDMRKQCHDRPLPNERAGEQIRYLFLHHGILLSSTYLFEQPLQAVSKAAGMVGPTGWNGKQRGTVSAHRFRHTVGTQLAERGAKLHTIMKVLGHSSVSMALVYVQVSDQEVLRDYKSVLEPGAIIADPAADELKSGTLPAEAVDWLKSNFLKTELELGHCLRLPAEGPCECDLYLTCAKFVTTPDYAPRLRARLEVEQQLVQDADDRGWTREVERHNAIARRLQSLLTDLVPDHTHTGAPANQDPTEPAS
ncbi:tyrosine-type recombinase/integrase (plasmid) [Streptosporangium sp. CA-135522]|uniref:tyrosine-type recombinase/integrase n=1 Tax=Streptosporangium sp. CA-135522 TaxID=3240072 RepID=UPI003D8D580B